MRKVDASWKAAVFVCSHDRDPDTGRACCGTAAGEDLRNWLKARAKQEGLKGKVLTAKSGCLDVCSPQGVTVAAIPAAGSAGERQMWVVSPDDDREAVFSQVCAALGVQR